MKKFVLSFIFILASVTTNLAQDKGKIELGAALSYPTEPSTFGLGAKARYGIANNIRLDGSISFFLPKTISGAYGAMQNYTVSSSLIDMSVNAQYVFKLSDKFSLYPLAGLGYYRYVISVSGNYGEPYIPESYGRLGINLGGGASYHLNNRISLGAELKTVLINIGNTTVLGANLMFAL